MRPTLEDAIRTLLNQYSRENESNTPDFILAEYMIKSLENFEKASKARETWYGKELKINQ